MSGIRRAVAAAMARDLTAFVLPGPAIARSLGLDLSRCHLRLVGTPRHAGVLIVVGAIPDGLRDAAAVAYAQMPRPRAILALGAGGIEPLPAADVSAPLTQEGLQSGLVQLRRVVASGGFHPDADDFTAAALAVRIEYTCPMHPEVVSDEPGACPKCGMDLVPRKTSAAGHGDHQQAQSTPEAGNHSGHGANPEDSCHADHSGHAQGAEAATYTCPMHPEVIRDAPGKCPECGMFLVKADEVERHGHRHGSHGQAPGAHVGGHHGDGDHCGHGEQEDHAGHEGHANHADHFAGGMDGIEPHFMSMVELTEGQPRSSDGLQMEWIEVAFGPFFPGLPAGLHLNLTLDGDSVAGSAAGSLVGATDLTDGAPMRACEFVERLATMMPLSPMAYRTLACAAIEEAAGVEPDHDARRGRAAAVERERIASHLNWLCEFGTQSGFLWLAARAGALQLATRDAGVDGIAAQAAAIRALVRRVEAAPLMRMRLGGIARVGTDSPASGPVDRARGGGSDARAGDPALKALGFEMRVREGGDALARLRLRCDEIAQSLDLIAAAGVITAPQVADVQTVSGEGAARIETPRGAARLRVRLVDGKVVEADLDTPSDVNIALVEPLTAQQELGDALFAVGSLDLSPWEIRE